MGIVAIIKKLAVIDKECKKDEVLRKKLEPWVEKMNKVKPSNRQEAMKISQELIDEYEKLKKQINNDIRSEYALRNRAVKIEQTNER